MALPMRKEESGPERVRPAWHAEMRARADALRKQLGRPLRMDIPDGLTDEEWEEAWQESVVATAEEYVLHEWDPDAPPRKMTLEEEMEAEGLLPPPEERERILAELRAGGWLPPGH